MNINNNYEINNSIIENISIIETKIKRLKQIYNSNEYKTTQTTHPLITSLWDQFLTKRLDNLNKNTEDFLNIYEKIGDIENITNNTILTLFILNSCRDLNI